MNFIKSTGLFLSAVLIMASCNKPGETVEVSDAQEVAEASSNICQPSVPSKARSL